MERLTIHQAKKRFYQGLPVALCPCRLNPQSDWQPSAILQKDPSDERSDPEQWEAMINSASYYNLSGETGKYFHYYKAETVLEKVIDCLPLKTDLIYGGGEFSKTSLCEAVEEWSMEPLYSEWGEWAWEQEAESVDGYIEELRKDCKDIVEDWDDFLEQHRDDIEEEIRDRDSGGEFLRTLRRSPSVPVRITMFSNNDCLNSDWYESLDGYSYDGYLGDILQALKINPAEFKTVAVQEGMKLVGRWPNYPKRVALVDIGDLCRELANNTNASNLVILGKVSAEDIGTSFKKVKVSKGASIGLFSHFAGGGSLLEIPAKVDFEIKVTSKNPYVPHWDIRVDDAKNSYSIQSVYGTDTSIFDEITLIK